MEKVFLVVTTNGDTAMSNNMFDAILKANVFVKPTTKFTLKMVLTDKPEGVEFRGLTGVAASKGSQLIIIIEEPVSFYTFVSVAAMKGIICDYLEENGEGEIGMDVEDALARIAQTKQLLDKEVEK